MPTVENSDLVESLVLAAGGDERGLAKVTHDLGIERIAPVLVDEVVFRANTGATGSPYGQPVDSTVLGTVVLRVHHGGATSSHLLHVHQHGRVSSAPGNAADAAVSLDYDLHDLLRVLFGPTRPRPNGTHTALFQPQHVGATDMPAPESVFMAMHAGATVMSGLAQHHPDLNELARRYKTDKWGGIHWFTGLYERHFREFRDTPVRLLEIGIGGYAHPSFGGESLRTWKRYFHRGLVFGVDIFDKSGVDEQRLTTVVADQGDPTALLEIDDRFGPFDIVIDDGSHVNGHVRTSFETLFPRLRSGGLYVVLVLPRLRRRRGPARDLGQFGRDAQGPARRPPVRGAARWR
jgi:demethylmacrocin O-methyltransferase